MLARLADAAAATIGEDRRGIVPVAMALEAGLTHDDLRRLRERGTLVRIGRGVTRLRDRPFDWESRCQAALDLAGPGAVLGARPSARIHRFYAYNDCDDVEVYVPRGTDHRTSIGRITATSWLPAEHVTVLDGFPVLTLGRTFFALCADPDPGFHYRHPAHERKMARVYNDAVARRGLTFTQQAAVLLVTAKRGRQGVTLVRALLLRFPPEHRAAESDDEFLFLELVETFGVPAPIRQCPISDELGFIGVVDNAWPVPKVVVEIDSSWHDGPIDREEDRERDRRLIEAGWLVERWRYPQLVGDPGAIARYLKRRIVERTPRTDGSRGA